MKNVVNKPTGADEGDEFVSVSLDDAKKLSHRKGFTPIRAYQATVPGGAVKGEFGRIDERRYVIVDEVSEVVGSPAADGRGDEDDVKEGDDKTFVTLAELKRFRRRTLDDVNTIIGPKGFQGEMIGMQTRLALVWNGVNAVLRAFLNKGLLTAEDVRSAGEELAKEAKANMAAAQKAIAEKRKLQAEERTQVPLETFREVLIPKRPTNDAEGGQ